jgi:hypothetical protein
MALYHIEASNRRKLFEKDMKSDIWSGSIQLWNKVACQTKCRAV